MFCEMIKSITLSYFMLLSEDTIEWWWRIIVKLFKLRSFLKTRELLRAGHLDFYFLEAKCVLSGRTLMKTCTNASVSGHYSSHSVMHLVLSNSNISTHLLLLWKLGACMLPSIKLYLYGYFC